MILILNFNYLSVQTTGN